MLMGSKESRKTKSNQRRKLTRVEQYALLAKSNQPDPARDNAQQQAAQLEAEVKATRSRGNARQIKAVEARANNEITARRPPESPYDRSFDVRVPIAQFAPQRGIDIGIWAEGSGFRMVTRGGWYDSEATIAVKKFFRGNVCWQVVTLLSVFLALFCADIWVVCQVSTNYELDSLLTVVLVIFGIEFIGLTATDSAYPFSFFFWMDLLGTLSMMFDISYMMGPDASEPERLGRKQGGLDGNVAVVRAARAARLGTRAARLSRVLKVMKYMPLVSRGEQHEDKVKMARVISNQLNDVMATRVALLTICIAITLPLFGMFDYPEVDDSLGAWTQVLSMDVEAYYSSLKVGAEAVKTAKQNLSFELRRFAEFYSSETYGPFSVCLGTKKRGIFECNPDSLDFDFDSVFVGPHRKASTWLMSEGRVQVSFNLATPQRLEAAASIALIWFILLSMVCFGVILSHSVSVIALQPLERMLSVVRERCAQIFKYTDDLQDDKKGAILEEDEEEQYDETKHANEFVLLEKAVSKLAAIADLSGKPEPDIHEKMDEDDMLVLNMTGVQVPSNALARQHAAHHRRSMTMLQRQSNNLHDMDDIDNPDHNDIVEELASKIPEHVLDLLDTWEFDSSELTKEMSIKVGIYLMLTLEGCSSWVRANVQEPHLARFIALCESKYLNNPFHNFAHALDVTWSVSRFGKLVEVEMLFGELTVFWMMVAGLGHDLGHEGLNNQFLIETSHKLALVYNDKSPLENMHCSTLFQILSDTEANVFMMVEKALFKEVRKGIINVILHTDITKHNDMVKQLSLLYQMNSEDFDAGGITDELLEILQSPTNSQTVLSMLLHTADVGNPMKPWPICMKLAKTVVEEFFNQGDLELKAGIPVQMLNDRTKVNMPNSQIGFIEFMIAPMVEAVVRVFPQLDALAGSLGMNLKNWLDVWLEECSPPADAVEKTTARVLKVYGKLMAAARTWDPGAHSMAIPTLSTGF